MENDTLQEVKTTEPPAKPSKPPTLRKDGQIDRRSVTAQANGAKNGEQATKKIKPDDLIEAAQRVIAGTSEERMRCDFSLSHAQAKFLMATAGLTAEEFRDRLAARMENAISLCLARILESVNEFELRDLSVTFGILNDHLLKMRGYNTPSIINQTNIQINGMERSAAMAMLSGKGNMLKNGSSLPLDVETGTHDLQAVSQAQADPDDGQA
jgi:hypothetical protein